jgi:DNA gyrase/topoisomerase IV subunit A
VSDSATEIDKLIFIEDYKSHKNDKKELDNALMALFDVIIGQCSPLLKSKLKALQSWEKMESNCEIGDLLKEIKSITIRLV